LVVFNVLKDMAGLAGFGSQNVAVVAHLVGAAFGFAYYRYQFRISPLFTGWFSRERRERRPARSGQLRIFQPEPAANPATANDTLATPKTATIPAPAAVAEATEHLEAKLDEVLDKVAKHGQASLTEAEREVLFKASEVYKKRRK
jgi:hypothetical protein